MMQQYSEILERSYTNIPK